MYIGDLVLRGARVSIDTALVSMAHVYMGPALQA